MSTRSFKLLVLLLVALMLLPAFAVAESKSSQVTLMTAWWSALLLRQAWRVSCA